MFSTELDLLKKLLENSASWSLLKGEEFEVEVEAADEVDTKFPTELGSLVSWVDFELGGFPCSFQQVSRRCPGRLQ